MFIPLYIDVSGWKVLIFGGGLVGLRRARLFLDAGVKEIVVVSAEFGEELLELASREPRVRLVRAVLPKDLNVIRPLIEKSNLVVVASSDPKANRALSDLALRLGKLVNNATDASAGNVVVPFRTNLYNGIYIAVTSLGKAGVVARKVLERIISLMRNDIEMKTFYKVMSKIKRYLKENVKDVKKRMDLYFMITGDEEFKELVRKGEEDMAYKRGIEIVCDYLRKDFSQKAKGLANQGPR